MRASFRALLIASIGIAPAVMLARAGDAPIGPPAPTTAPATALAGASPATAPAPSPIQARLSRRIPELRLDSVPLGDALAAVADLTKVNLSVRWPRLEAAGVNRTTRVKLHLWDVTLGQALTIILADVYAPLDEHDGVISPRFTYWADDNLVVVSIADDRQRPLPTVVYNVRDLLAMEAARSRPTPPEAADASTGSEADEALRQLLINTVEPDSWSDNGSPGLIRNFAGMLVVQQTPENHGRIVSLLGEIRAAGGKFPGPSRPATGPAGNSGSPGAK